MLDCAAKLLFGEITMDDIETLFSRLGLALENANPNWDFHVNEYGVLCSDNEERSIAAEVARPDYQSIEIDDPDELLPKKFDPSDANFEQQVAEHFRRCGLNLPNEWMRA